MSFNVKALGAFRKLGAAVLITAATLALAGLSTSCKQTPTPKPKHAITFSVDSTTPNGTLKAKADGVPETSTSPINVEEGKTVTFTAKANDGYRVKGWTLDGKPITEAGTNTEYKLKVSKPATVSVSFEAIPPTKYTVTLTQTEGGTVTALPEIPADKLMVKDTEITFTAEANDGYKIGKWTVTGSVLEGSTGADGSETAKVKITADTTVSVSFTKKTYAVNFSVEGGNGTLKAKTEGMATETEASPINVEESKTVTFTAKANDGYRVKGWTLDGKPITEAGTNTEYKLKVSKPATVKVSFEAIPKHAITFSVEGGTGGTLKAEGDGIAQPATSPITVEHGKEVTFTATADAGYRLKGWKLDDSTVNGTVETYTLTVTQPATVTVSFELRPVKGEAVFILSPNNLNIRVVAKTADGSDITVEGCTETTLASNTQTRLHATGTKVILKGNITELSCRSNQLTALDVHGLTKLQTLKCGGNKLTTLNVQGLTALQQLDCGGNQLTTLNVQGCTALQQLYCGGNKLTVLDVQGLPALKILLCFQNKLNADAFTKLFNDLPAREVSDKAKALLYADQTASEENCTNFSTPESLKKAFENAKNVKHWKLRKMAGYIEEDI